MKTTTIYHDKIEAKLLKAIRKATPTDATRRPLSYINVSKDGGDTTIRAANGFALISVTLSKNSPLHELDSGTWRIINTTTKHTTFEHMTDERLSYPDTDKILSDALDRPEQPECTLINPKFLEIVSLLPVLPIRIKLSGKNFPITFSGETEENHKVDFVLMAMHDSKKRRK